MMINSWGQSVEHTGERNSPPPDPRDDLIRRLKVALLDAARECEEHNAEYKYYTPVTDIAAWRDLAR